MVTSDALLTDILTLNELMHAVFCRVLTIVLVHTRCSACGLRGTVQANAVPGDGGGTIKRKRERETDIKVSAGRGSMHVN